MIMMMMTMMADVVGGKIQLDGEGRASLCFVTMFTGSSSSLPSHLVLLRIASPATVELIHDRRKLRGGKFSTLTLHHLTSSRS